MKKRNYSNWQKDENLNIIDICVSCQSSLIKYNGNISMRNGKGVGCHISAKYGTFHDNRQLGGTFKIAKKVAEIFKESGNEMVHMYSWVGLVLPFTEELISRPFVGENRF